MSNVISEPAKQGLNFIFSKAARANLRVHAADTIEIEALPGLQIVETPEKKIVVLTVASYLFRLLTIFHVNDDKVTESYFTKSDHGRSFDEAFGEIGNVCCGVMNRELGNYFPHTGMSTPFVLESKCLPFLNELKPGYVSQHRISINNSVSMHATLCLCAYAPINFRVDTAIAAEETGELELF
ncbi:hypothetical protein [Propionivibrio sp.]|uniref:hypothetical protein n=1 Tax=Propionivibrio sp. TaxID=2212460 RepID=UPI003BEFF322